MPAKPACKAVSFRGHQLHSQPVLLQGLDKSERYASVLSCGGQTLLFTRKQIKFNFEWVTNVRSLSGCGSLRSRKGSLQFLGPSAPKALAFYSHNAAADCIGNGTVAVYGGQDRFKMNNKVHAFEGGIARITTRIPTAGAEVRSAESWPWDLTVANRNLTTRRPWDPAQAEDFPDVAVLNGDKKKTQCVENREAFTNCEFDGKFHLVRLNGVLLMYARANSMAEIGKGNTRHAGGRHAQVAASSDNGLTWGPFSMVKIDGYTRSHANNVYFLLVEKYFDRAVQAERLVGLFPGNANGASGVFLMTSSDGLHFSKPELLLSSKTWGKQERTTDYPVAVNDLEDGTGGTSIILQHGVQVHDYKDPNMWFCRYVLEGGLSGGLPASAPGSPGHHHAQGPHAGNRPADAKPPGRSSPEDDAVVKAQAALDAAIAKVKFSLAESGAAAGASPGAAPGAPEASSGTAPAVAAAPAEAGLSDVVYAGAEAPGAAPIIDNAAKAGVEMALAIKSETATAALKNIARLETKPKVVGREEEAPASMEGGKTDDAKAEYLRIGARIKALEAENKLLRLKLQASEAADSQLPAVAEGIQVPVVAAAP